MKIFSNIFKQKNKEISLKSVLSIWKKLEKMTSARQVSDELYSLLDKKSTNKADYMQNLSKLKEIAMKNTMYLDDLKDDFSKIKSSNHKAEFHGFEGFHKDFQTLICEYKILAKVNKKEGNSNEKTVKLHSDYKILHNIYEKSAESSKILQNEQNSLSKEIEKYSETVNEISSKYRLSIDWDGKKPLMISLGKKLKVRRETLIERENILNKEIKVLYAEYPMLRQRFLQNIDDFERKLIENCKNQEIDEISKIIKEYEKLLQNL